MTIRSSWLHLAVAFGFAVVASSIANAQDSQWNVSKASGDVWFTTSEPQPVALTTNSAVKPGATVHTGQNGRVLLVRGTESMLISANSIVTIPADQATGMTTTLLQQAGTILLDVEKKNVPHFEVATPHLAAVVKGTKFQVTVTNSGSQVEVQRGQVEVSGYKSGQYALVNPEQSAQVSAQGQANLSLSGHGTLSPIQKGTPRASAVSAITIPGGGFVVPDLTHGGQLLTAPAPERRAENVSPSSSGATPDSGSASGFVAWAKAFLGMDGHNHRDDPTYILALTGIIGFSVTAGAAVLRRKPKDKNGTRR